MLPKPKTILTLFSIVLLLLIIPLIAMQFTNEVNWSAMDFLMAGILLFGASLAIEFVVRKVKSRKNRIIICVIIIVLLLLVWAELAVGLFGSLIAGN
jgi:peptidoglycan/LPS O-acetylase OafA/YrhL